MSTANLQSVPFENIKVVSSMLANEENNSGTNATTETPSSGMFMTPSTVAGRSADVTGFLVTAENELGKFEWSDPEGFLNFDDLAVTVGTVTQLTDITTGVTLAGSVGTITTEDANAAAENSNSFTVTNSTVVADSVVVLTLKSYAGNGIPVLSTANVGAGVFDIVITNAHSSAALSAPLEISFVVFQSPA